MPNGKCIIYVCIFMQWVAALHSPAHTRTQTQRTPFCLVPPTTTALVCRKERQEATFSKQTEAVSVALVGGHRAILQNFNCCFVIIPPHHDALQGLLLLRMQHTKASRLGKRLLSWLDWPNSISSFCFLNIFFIFCNKINTITLFWYYVSCSSVKRPPAKCLLSHAMLTKLNISTRGIIVCCTVIAFITSLCLFLFLARCVVFVPP